MAPMKYEDQMRDKLEQRKLQPSANAWQKLSDKLDVNQSKKNNKGFWYLGIAASIVGILLITNVFNNTANGENVDTIIVDTNTKVDTENTNANKLIITQNESQADKKEVIINTENKANTIKKKEFIKQSILKQKIDTEQLKLNPSKTEESVVADITKEKALETEASTTLLRFEEQKAKDIVAQIQTLQKTKEVTDEDIDALLNAAQKEITLKRLYNQNTKTIDANALLLSVEDDIEEQSFRTRVFEMLKSGYKEVKTAVAERNN